MGRHAATDREGGNDCKECSHPLTAVSSIAPQGDIIAIERGSVQVADVNRGSPADMVIPVALAVEGRWLCRRCSRGWNGGLRSVGKL